jgi:hypothetical protein
MESLAKCDQCPSFYKCKKVWWKYNKRCCSKKCLENACAEEDRAREQEQALKQGKTSFRCNFASGGGGGGVS